MAVPLSLDPGARDRQIAAFLETCGWGAAARGPLADDASFRRYDRLRRGAETAVLMDAPPPREDVRPFVRVGRMLRDLGLSAPALLGIDEAAGLLLLEDFGDRTFTRALAEGVAEAPLYNLAVDLLIALHARFAPGEADASSDAGAGIPVYDESRLLDEAALLPDWFLPAVTGETLPAAERASYLEAWRAVLPLIHGVPESLVLRDYHVDNLMLLGEREDVAACGLLDFQDAVIGPVTYDLVSLLEDARRDVGPAVAAASLERYLASAPQLDRAAFAASYAVLGAQRNAKIVGIFTRLWKRDGKPAYLPHIARVWRLLRGDLEHAALRPVRDWFDQEVPPALRRVPDPGAMP